MSLVVKKKYLPIGTICTLKGKQKKVMIIGFCPIQFNGNIKMTDYYGCAYPEGMLLPQSVCLFNHTDIEKIDFNGYTNEEQIVFQNLLNDIVGADLEAEKAKKFHEENEMYLTSNKSYSKLLFDENGVVMIAEPVKNNDLNKPTLKNVEFDENGVVVSAENVEVANPFHKDYNNQLNKTQTNSNPKKWGIFKDIQFDKNGTVTSDGTKPKSNIEFDENGTVISDGTKPKSNIEFDENGTVISDGTKPKSNIEFDENGTVISDASEIVPKRQLLYNIEFDENGTVISAS